MTAQTKQRQQPTREQIVRLYSLAHHAGLSHDMVKAEIWARYGIESTKELDPRQYEQYTRELELRARVRSPAVERAAKAAMHYPKLHDRKGIDAVLREQWPQLCAGHPKLAADLAEVLDFCRLTRATGTISPRIVEVQIQRWRKLPLNVIAEAAEVYLNRYTSRNERYFAGILRRIMNDRKRAERAAKRKAKAEKKQREAIEREIEQVLLAAGPSPVAGSQRHDLDGQCVCRAGKLLHRVAGADRHAEIPCPWCHQGIELLRRGLATRGIADNLRLIRWADVRDEVLERLEEEEAEDG